MRGVFFILILFLKISGLFNLAYANDGSDVYIDKSCIIFADIDPNGNVVSNLSAKYARPLTTRVVECIDGSLAALFLREHPQKKFTLFQEFQSAVKPLIILILILYVAANGYLIAMGKGIAEKPKQEILLFILKFSLVFYFAIGDAWKDFFFNAIRSVAGTLGSILIEAGVNGYSDGCIFTGRGVSPYPFGKGYLAVFDTMDCKFANYIGWFVGRKFPVFVPLSVVFFFTGAFGVFMFAIAFTFTFQLIMIAFRVVQLYLLSIITLTILIYASPIIIPMALFDYTKDMFNKWLSKVLGLMIHPVIVFGFLGIMLSLMDRIYYGPNPDDSNLFLVTSPQETRNSGNIVYGNQVNPDCYPQYSGFLSAVKKPSTCLAAFMEKQPYLMLGLPIHRLIEIIQIPLPSREMLRYGMPFMMKLLIGIILNMCIGYMVQKVDEDIIKAISGVDVGKALGPKMVEGTLGAAKAGRELMQNAQDKVLKRKNAVEDKPAEDPKNTTSGGSAAANVSQGNSGPANVSQGNSGPANSSEGNGGPANSSEGNGGPANSSEGQGGSENSTKGENPAANSSEGNGGSQNSTTS